MTIEVPELAPCPLCGGEARIVSGDEAAYVQCEQVKMHRALWFKGDNAAADIVRDEWNRRAQPIPGTVGVRELEWVKPYGSRTLTKVETIVGIYRAWTHHEASGRWFWDLQSLIGFGPALALGEGDSEAEVRAACWADYEPRILSALTQGSQP